MAWAEIEQAAQGSSLQLMMWQGDPFINRYVSEYLQPQLKERFGIELQVSSGQGPAIVSNLMTEIEAGKDESEIDLVWINGETFFQLRQIDALHGPFTQQLPNAQYIDFDNKFIGQDFQQPIDGFECPWGNVQLAIIYDSLRTPEPPRSLEALEAYVKAHPGKFTIPNEFTGMTLLKSWLIAFAGGQDALNGPFDEAKYEKHSATLWAYVNRLKPYFWKQGETFPRFAFQHAPDVCQWRAGLQHEQQ
jgi:putative spermidine/putrescine transport system substrate-binding protein